MVFTLIGWLFVYSAIVVVAATIVQAFSEDDGQPGMWLRGPGA
jgi:membrane protein